MRRIAIRLMRPTISDFISLDFVVGALDHPQRDLPTVYYWVIQSLKNLSKTGALVACKKRSVLQDQHLLLNLGLHFVSPGPGLLMVRKSTTLFVGTKIEFESCCRGLSRLHDHNSFGADSSTGNYFRELSRVCAEELRKLPRRTCHRFVA